MNATKIGSERSREVLASIAREAREAGMLQADTVGVAARAIVCGIPLVALLAVAWLGDSTAIALIAAAGAGFACVQLGFIAHDASHGAVSARHRGNMIAGHLAFTILNGLGFSSWRESHNDHHRFCQDESRDPDMAVGVVMSLTPGSAARKTGLGRLLLPFQGLLLWPLSLFFAHSLRVESISRSYTASSRHVGDALLLPIHYALWFALPVFVLEAGVGRVVAVYLVTSAVMGAYLAALFWVNHIGMPAINEGHELTRLEQQVIGSRNVRHGRWLDFAFGGLDFQIEHHLLPAVSSGRLRELQRITRRQCIDAGLPYYEQTFPEAIVAVTRCVQRIALES